MVILSFDNTKLHFQEFQQSLCPKQALSDKKKKRYMFVDFRIHALTW